MTRSKVLFAVAATALFAAAPALEASAQIRGSGRAHVGHGGGPHGAGPGGGPRPGGGGPHNRPNPGGRDVNINVNDNRHGRYDRHDHDHGYDWDDHYHPIARGMAVGAAAAVTSAVVGSMIYSLPPSCSRYRDRYYSCGGVYYEPQYQGDTVVYVVVNQP